MREIQEFLTQREFELILTLIRKFGVLGLNLRDSRLLRVGLYEECPPDDYERTCAGPGYESGGH